MQFYESEVPVYEALNDFADSLDSTYYMGCGFDMTPAETLESEVLHVDKDSYAVEFLNNRGYNTLEEDITSYNPERDFDLILLSHIPTFTRPLLEPNMTEHGMVACQTDTRAEKIGSRDQFEPEAVYTDGKISIIEDLEGNLESELYIFRI